VNAGLGEATVSEIIAATKDGSLLVYTDASAEALGFIAIGNPYSPLSFGTVSLEGSPTSVDVLGNELALVAVDTSDSFVDPSGHLAVIDVATRAIVATLDLGGQPDSLKVSPDGRYAAIAIENQRDEEIEVDGEEGGLPQLPGGFLVIVDLVGVPGGWGLRTVDLSGLSAYAPEDPEVEFVDVNARNEAVITLQENNHIVIVDLVGGTVTGDFPAGTVDLVDVDNDEDGLISLTQNIAAVPREPDAITWVPAGYGRYRIATANEGDLFGGSRGFSIFERSGSVVYDSGNEFEEIAVQHGHYPEDRSENKGAEPESIEYGRYGRDDYLFVGSERGSFVAVYKLGWNGQPEFEQLLPAPLGPEGVLAIPERGLLVVSGEEDDPSFGVRSTVMIYKLMRGAPAYPQILSDVGPSGSPIPWSALSGMVAVPGRSNKLLAVWDSYYAEGRIFTIDVSEHPAVIEKELAVLGDDLDLDSEGIAVAPDGTYWIASEGNATDSRPNRLLQVDSLGNIIAVAGLPEEILNCRAASTNRGALGSGFEGVAVLRSFFGYKLLVAQQRGWDYTTPECEELDDDPDGANSGEPPLTRIWIYDPADESWDHIGYELESIGPDATWVGLSEITEVGDGTYILIERDNRTGDFTDLKTLVRVRTRAGWDGIIEKHEKSVYDLVPALESTNGWITDKPEGVAVTRDGRVFVVTDNDGVEDWSGETWFLRLGRVRQLFH
jgi:DNA-binding beta-propeller fold protein YncE